MHSSKKEIDLVLPNLFLALSSSDEKPPFGDIFAPLRVFSCSANTVDFLRMPLKGSAGCEVCNEVPP